MHKKYCIVDPIFRGSRMFVTSILARSLLSLGISVEIVTRHDAGGEQYEELFDGIPHVLHRRITYASEVWYGRIPRQGVRDTLRFMEEFCQDEIGGFFFTGYNEYFPLLPLFLLRAKANVRQSDLIVIDYTANHYLQRSNWLRTDTLSKVLLKRFISFALARRFLKFVIILLDERVDDPNYVMRTDLWGLEITRFPDPSPSSERFIDDGAIDLIKKKILLVGKQTRRKGLAEALDVIESVASSDNVSEFIFQLVGELTPETEKLRERLNRLPAHIFQWNDSYVSEQEIYDYYAWADYVLLPYTREFSGSSGVLAYASAASVPVIVTDHGCIGYRIKKWQCGLLYEAGNNQELFTCLIGLPRSSAHEYSQLVDGIRAFGESCTCEAFTYALKGLICTN